MRFNIKYFLLILLLIIASVTAATIPDADASLYLNHTYQKPKTLNAFVWLQQLEAERDQAEQSHQLDVFEELSREISATLAGKYGISKRSASSEERQIMMASIIRTRDCFAGKPDIINDFYFGYDKTNCWQKIENDPAYVGHMGVIVAVDAIRWGVVTNRPIYDTRGNIDPNQKAQDVFEALFNKQRQQTIVDHDFKEAVRQIATHIHSTASEVGIRNLVDALSEECWKSVVLNVGEIADIIAPHVDFLDTYLCDFSSFENKGWTGHHIEQFATWLRESDLILASDKKEFMESIYKNPKRFKNYVKALLQPMTSHAVLLTPANKAQFRGMPSDIPFDGTTVAVEYRFFHPLLRNREGVIIPPTLSFYLTRRLSEQLVTSILGNAEPVTMQKKTDVCQDIVLFLHRLYFEEFYDEEIAKLF